MVKVIFLGTNGWFDTQAGNTICTLIETPREYIILDAGNGIHRADRYIKKKKPVYLFLSHFHLDHIVGLHVLPKFRFTNPVGIYGPKGTRKYLGALLRRPYTAPFEHLPMKAELFEIERDRPAAFGVEFAPLVHSTMCYGYRFAVGGRVIAYCTDTGPCPGLISLGRGSDLLICESSYLPGQKPDSWPHLRPEDAAAAAVECGTKRLALTHFDASRYPDLASRGEAQKVARRIFKPTIAARDGMVLEL
ncbi:MAG TPA: MBL fold metallo-hydrolase [Spirochaetota bacterium]|nr:MBL fold metallo-hydrolase [Spirochaetota bacterium]HRT76083.1 MBL fold metallo-hydrolase [Spirochaetota bacterium]